MKYLLVVIFSLFIFGCSNSNNPIKKDDDDNNNQNQKIKIGVLLPTTGSASSSGESTRAALDFVLQDTTLLNQLIQASASVDIELFYYDTQTNPEVALSGLTTMYAQGINTFIGPFTSAELEAVLPFAEENNLVLISPSAVASALSVPKTNVFRFIPDNDIQAKAVQKYMSRYDIDYLVGIHRYDLWAYDLIQSIVGKNMYGDEILNNAFPFFYDDNLQHIRDVTSVLASRISQMNKEVPSAQTAGYLATFSEGALILEYLSAMEANYKLNNLKLIGSSALANNSAVLNNLKAAEYAIKTKLVCPIYSLENSTRHLWEPIVNGVKQRIGRDPEVYAIISCDALQIILKAYISSKDEPTIDNIRNKVKEHTNSIGITGNLELDQFNDRKFGNYDFWSVEKEGQNQFSWKKVYTYIALEDKLLTF